MIAPVPVHCFSITFTTAPGRSTKEMSDATEAVNVSSWVLWFVFTRLAPCKTVSPPVRNGAPPFVIVAVPAKHRDLHCGRYITVEPRNEPVSPWRRPGLPWFLTSFPAHPSCIKHFKTAVDMSQFNTVHPGSQRFSMVPPPL